MTPEAYFTSAINNAMQLPLDRKLSFQTLSISTTKYFTCI